MKDDECTRRLRSVKFHPILGGTHIIGVKAHHGDIIRQKCIGAGMNSIIYKPISTDKIGHERATYNISAGRRPSIYYGDIDNASFDLDLLG